MDAFAQPIETLVLIDEVLQAPAQLNSATDWIFDARACVIDAAYGIGLPRLFSCADFRPTPRVLVKRQQNSGSFQKICIAVHLGEAEDLIEMERIERDLGF